MGVTYTQTHKENKINKMSKYLLTLFNIKIFVISSIHLQAASFSA